MTRLVWLLTLLLSGCSLLLGDSFDGLTPRADAGTNTKPQDSSSQSPAQRETKPTVPNSSGCQPVSEVCNGKDDDCDGDSDEAEAVAADCATKLLHTGSVCMDGYCLRVGPCHVGFYNCDGLPDNGCESSCPCSGCDEDAGSGPAASSGGAGGTGGTGGIAGGSASSQLCPDAPCPSKARCLGSGSNRHCECQSGFILTDNMCKSDACADVACGTGGRCTSDGMTATCQCERGFMSAGGSEPCIAIDDCAAENMCSSMDYPCKPTVPFYYCQGQLAEWPMPDTSSGAKFAPSYDRSQEGVVVDQITHLMWQRTLPSSYAGCTGGEAESAGSKCSWPQAKAYCAELDVAGFSDWRLPSKIEHESIVSHSVAAPALDHDAFADSGMYGDFWTASSVSGDATSAWIVSTFSGETRKGTLETFSLVRCVRTAQEPSGLDPQMHFVGAVDNRTGLHWQLDPPADRFTPAQAVDYCAQLTDDRGGWRLPSVKELMTIVDPTRNNPAIVPSLDASGVADDFWANDGSAVPHSGNSTWYVSFKDGSSFYCCYNAQSEQTKRVRCVR